MQSRPLLLSLPFRPLVVLTRTHRPMPRFLALHAIIPDSGNYQCSHHDDPGTTKKRASATPASRVFLPEIDDSSGTHATHPSLRSLDDVLHICLEDTTSPWTGSHLSRADVDHARLDSFGTAFEHDQDKRVATAAAMAAFSTFLDTADGGNAATVTLVGARSRSGAGGEVEVSRSNTRMKEVTIPNNMYTTASSDGESLRASLGASLDRWTYLYFRQKRTSDKQWGRR